MYVQFAASQIIYIKLGRIKSHHRFHNIERMLGHAKRRTRVYKMAGILWQNVDKHVPSPQPIPKNVFHYDEALVWKGKFENYLKSLQNKEYTSWVAVEHIICIYTLSSRYHYMEKLSINGTFLSINRVR